MNIFFQWQNNQNISRSKNDTFMNTQKFKNSKNNSGNIDIIFS